MNQTQQSELTVSLTNTSLIILHLLTTHKTTTLSQPKQLHECMQIFKTPATSSYVLCSYVI